MLRINKYKIIALMLTLVLVCGMSAQSTLAYITAKTDKAVNTFIPVKSLNIAVIGEKTIEGRDWQEGDKFEFKLKQIDESGRTIEAVTVTSATYNAEGDHSFSFSNAVRGHIKQAGVYHFSITEKAGDAEGITYSEDDYRFTVTVSEDEITGGLVVSEVAELRSPDRDVKKPELSYDEETGEYGVRARFANQYEAPPIVEDPDPVKAYITVEKKMEYKNADKGEKIGPAGFMFALEEDSVADDRHQRITDAEGHAVFELEYDKDDIGKTYIYSLKEVDEASAGVEYSDEEYEVHVTVTERDNVLNVDITCEDSAKDTFEFTNVYDCSIGGGDGTADPDGPGGESGDDSGDGLGGGDGETRDDGSKTGDDSDIILPLLIMLISGAMIVLIAVENRRRKFRVR